MTPKKPDWFEMTEGDTPATGLRKVNKTLPIGALLVAGALLFGGSLFAQDQSAVAVQTKTASITAVPVNSVGVPTIAPVVGISTGDDDDDEDGDHRGGRGHDDDDEDDDEDDEEEDD
jgi:hypothetical protein